MDFFIKDSNNPYRKKQAKDYQAWRHHPKLIPYIHHHGGRAKPKARHKRGRAGGHRRLRETRPSPSHNKIPFIRPITDASP